MIDPDYLESIEEPFVDFETPNETSQGRVFRIHRPSLGHVIILQKLGTPIIPDALVGPNGWAYETTVSAVACLLTRAGTPVDVMLEARAEIARAEAFLREGFGPWLKETPEEWGNPEVDAILTALTHFCATSCRPPMLEMSKNALPAKTPWPLLLASRAPARMTWEEAWSQSVNEAFWNAEADSEASGRGCSTVSIKDKVAMLKQTCDAAINKNTDAGSYPLKVRNPNR